MSVFVKRIVGGLCVRREQSGDIFPKQSVFQHGAHLRAKFVGVAPAIHPTARSCVGKKGLDVLSVAVWDRPEATKDTAKVYGVNWSQIINAGQVPTELYGIEGIPHIILFGPDGTILKRNLRGEEIGKEISKYIR